MWPVPQNVGLRPPLDADASGANPAAATGLAASWRTPRAIRCRDGIPVLVAGGGWRGCCAGRRLTHRPARPGDQGWILARGRPVGRWAGGSSSGRGHARPTAGSGPPPTDDDDRYVLRSRLCRRAALPGEQRTAIGRGRQRYPPAAGAEQIGPGREETELVVDDRRQQHHGRELAADHEKPSLQRPQARRAGHPRPEQPRGGGGGQRGKSAHAQESKPAQTHACVTATTAASFLRCPSPTNSLPTHAHPGVPGCRRTPREVSGG